MRHYQFTALALVLALGASAPAFAQSDTSSDNSSVWSQVANGQTVTGEGTEASGEAGKTFAKDEPWHPLVNYVDQRDLDQQNRIDNDEAAGTITSTQAAADQAALTHRESVQDAQEASNNGHLSFSTVTRDNHALNRASMGIVKQRFTKK